MGVSFVSPFFLRSAEELCQRLQGLGAPDARAMAVEAREFTELFQRWLTEAPDDATRTAAISRFLDLNRRANELLARSPPPSSRRDAPPSSDKVPPPSGESPPASSGRGVPRVYEDDDGD